MDIKVYARNVDTKLRLGIYSIAAHAMFELCGYENPRLDKIQINRWKKFRRHLVAVQKNCEPVDLNCRKKQRQALLQWAYNPFI